MSFFRLKDLIRAVRVCKTAADERHVIQRESAAIRTSFKEDNSQDTRYVNIQKLLYIYLLGFPVQFGQLECLKLAASPRFSDKRVGYLGTMLLLDEKQEILTLLTNSLKSDMNSPDDYMVGLALCTLSNVASSEVANDLVDEVERLIDSSRSYLRKKAALAAVRIIRREPELADPFLRRGRILLGDKHHGVQLAAVALATEMCTHSQQALDEIRKLVPIIVRQLRALLSAGSSPEHDVAGVVDPFLQVAILRLLRIVARGSQEAADELNDVLTQVATQTDGSKNVGTAILYECAVTALAIPSEQSLRVLAINLLGKFLANRDNNVRYVALATLSTAVITEAPSVQRHRNTVIACLRDNDISIRRRALDLSFALINTQNIKTIVAELLKVLPITDLEFKPSMVYRLSAAITLFGDSLEWRIENIINVMRMAGNHMNARDMFKFIRLVAGDADEKLQQRTARTCYAILNSDISQEKMVISGSWIIGEYADLLVADGSSSVSGNSLGIGGLDDLGIGSNQQTAVAPGLDEDDLDILGELGKPIPKEKDEQSPSIEQSNTAPLLFDPDEPLPEMTPEPADIVRLLSAITSSPIVSPSCRHVALTALAKLSGRFPTNQSVISGVKNAFAKHTSSMDAETQTRSVEFSKLLSSQLDKVRDGVVERMPAPEYPDVPYEEYVLNPTAMRLKALTIISRPEITSTDLLGSDDLDGSDSTADAARAAEANKQSVMSDLLNLMDDGPSESASTSLPQSQSQPQSNQTTKPAATTNVDLLSDLLGSTSVSSPPPMSSPPMKSPQVPAVHNLLEEDSSPAVSTVSHSADSIDMTDMNKEYEVYNQNGIRITLTPSKKPKSPTVIDLLATFYNIGDEAISDLSFLVAVPKSQKLQILPPSGQSVTVGASVTQMIRVSNPSKAPIRLRLKLSFSSYSKSYTDLFEFSSFPKSIV